MIHPTAELQGFTYRYPDWADHPTPVLCDVDVALGPGLTLVGGDSGSGKSTMLRVLNGLVPHFHGGQVSGRATVCGLDVLTTPTRQLARRVGFVFQEPEAGFVRGTVLREVMFGPENLGLPAAATRHQVADALDRVGIGGLARRRIRTLSGGERQRVALAAALAAAPEVVVLDEPMSQLDEDGAASLGDILDELARGGHTVVMAEHRLSRFSVPPRVVAMEGGHVVEVAFRPQTSTSGPMLRSPVATGPVAWSLRGVTVGIADRSLAHDVDVSGGAGEVVVVTGPNGAGKTTLLRTIAGLLPPLNGQVERRPGRVAYLPQEPGVLLHRHSVRAEIEQTLRWTETPGGPDGLLELFGLSDIADRDPRDLSVGQRQRAALAVVLAGRPVLALLDEPTRGMDSHARRSLKTALQQFAGDGVAVVMATHDRHLARELAARTLRMAEGAVKAETLEPRP